MKFTCNCSFYSVNDDGTITVGVKKDNGYNDYFRCKAKYSTLKLLEGLEKGTMLNCEFTLIYSRGIGLVLYINDVVEVS